MLKSKTFKVIAAIGIAAQFLAAQTVWNGTADTEWYTSNTDAETYTITTAEQLAGLAVLVNGGTGFAGKTVKLGANIALNDTTNWQTWDASTAPANVWNPIGTSSFRFQGTLDGDGYVVRGVYISSTSNYQGLFGYVTGTVKNLGITASYVKGADYTGGLAGRCGNINNCYSIGTKVTAGSSDYVGGLVGYNNGNISASYSTGLVTGGGTTYGGGLVGYNSSATVSSSYFDTQTSGKGVQSGKGSGKTTTEMQSQDITDSLNIAAGYLSAMKWGHNAGNYPTLLRGQVADNPLRIIFDGGTGTEADPFLVSSRTTLEKFRDTVNAGRTFAGLYVKLTADIELNDTTNWQTWSETNVPAYVWGNPIGTTATNAFRGTFDGNGKVIKGLYIDVSTGYRGLFGYFGNGGVGTLKNLGVVGAYVRNTSGGYTGTLVGQNIGLIDNCHTKSNVVGVSVNSMGGLVGSNSNSGVVSNSRSEGTVSGQDFIGGLVGMNQPGQIRNSYSTCAVTGRIEVGGLAGRTMNSPNRITDSYAAGNVSGDSIVGGLVGQNSSGQIYNCYATGNVTATKSYVGGLTGQTTGTTNNCYATGNVTGRDTIGGLVGFTNTNSMISNGYSAGEVKATATKPAFVGGVLGLRGTGVVVNNCYYDKEKSGQSNVGKGEGQTTAQMQNVSFANNLTAFAGLLPADTEAKSWIYSANKYPTLSNTAAPATNIATYFAGGTGTESSPYMINTRQQLVNLSMFVSMGIDFRGRHLKLGADIELNDNSANEWMNYRNTAPANVWLPIGTGTGTGNTRSFRGTFDGNYKTIGGVYIISESGSGGIGLFGNVDTVGTVKNLGLINSYIRSTTSISCSGTLTGDMAGKIENCYSTAWIAGNSYIGGLCGRTMYANAKISNSYFAGTVEMIGGSPNNIGGLVGGSALTPKSTVSNTYSAGKVIQGSITGSLGSAVGALVGNGTGVAVSGGYFDRDLNSGRNTMGSGTTDNANPNQYTTKMQLQETFVGWDFDAVWKLNPKKNDGYPHLQGFTYAEDPRTVQEICYSRDKIWDSDCQNCIEAPLEERQEACTATGNIWDLTLDRCRTKIDWYDGKISPYTVTSASDLLDLEFLVNEGIDNFENKTIELGANVSLSDIGNWKPIGVSSVTAFKGTFDGKGKTVSGLSSVNQNFAGLFGYISDGQVKNVNIIASQISAAWSGKTYAGILAGFYDSDKQIDNVYVSGNVLAQGGMGSSDSCSAGGLVGWTNKDNLLIKNSRAGGEVYGPANGTGGQSITIGGLVGYVKGEELRIEGSYSNVNTSGITEYAGGLIGFARGSVSIENSHAGGEIYANSSSAYVGGLIGAADDDVSIEKVYFSGSVSCNWCQMLGATGAIAGYADAVEASSVYYDNSIGAAIGENEEDINGALAVNTAALKTQATFIGWDFKDTWSTRISRNDGFPYLKALESTYELKLVDIVRPALVKAEFDFTGEPISVALNTPNAALYTLSGDVEKTAAGDYTATVTLVNPVDYKWKDLDAGVASFPLSWTIKPKGATPIVIPKSPDGRYGILLEKAVAMDIARMSVKTEEAAQIKIVITDNLGNVLFEANGRDTDTFDWRLTNKAGRKVANGAYLILVEARGVSGKVYTYSTKIGVKR